jgi:hypothetical protein
MDALEVETSIAEGEQALQALLQFARERGGTLEAHDAEKGVFTRRLPIGLAAMQRYFAQRGTGAMSDRLSRGPTGCSWHGSSHCEDGTTARALARSRWPGPATVLPGHPGAARWTSRSTCPSGATPTSCRKG